MIIIGDHIIAHFHQNPTRIPQASPASRGTAPPLPIDIPEYCQEEGGRCKGEGGLVEASKDYFGASFSFLRGEAHDV